MISPTIRSWVGRWSARGRERDPFSAADSCGSCGGLRRLPALDLHDDSLSTDRRQSGILVNVHPVLLWNTEALQLQSPRSGPSGQPNESSHLDQDDFSSNRRLALNF
jgi:hypothetical protein